MGAQRFESGVRVQQDAERDADRRLTEGAQDQTGERDADLAGGDVVIQTLRVAQDL